MKARSLALEIVVAALVVTAASLSAQDGLKGALSGANLTSAREAGSPFSQILAAADFDGDIPTRWRRPSRLRLASASEQPPDYRASLQGPREYSRADRVRLLRILPEPLLCPKLNKKVGPRPA